MEFVEINPVMKLVLIGKFGVGKTSIIHQYIHETFPNEPNEIQSQKRENQRNKDIFEVELIDSMGREKDEPLTHFYYQKCHGCALVFDKNDPESLTHLHELYDQVKMFGAQNMGMILIGNKSDLECKIDNSEAQQFATEHQMRYFSLTAKEKPQVMEAIEYLVDIVYKKYYEKQKSCCLL